MKYWDSSAVMPLLLDEPFSGSVYTTMRGDNEMVSWWGTPTECCSALARVRCENGITTEDEQMLRSRLDELVEFWNEKVIRSVPRRGAYFQDIRSGRQIRYSLPLLLFGQRDVLMAWNSFVWMVSYALLPRQKAL